MAAFTNDFAGMDDKEFKRAINDVGLRLKVARNSGSEASDVPKSLQDTGIVVGAASVPNEAVTEPILEWSVFQDGYAKSIVRQSGTFEQFCELIRTTDECTDKDSTPWLKLAKFGDVRSVNDCYRTNNNLMSVFGVEGDYDGEKVSFEVAVDTLREAGIKGVVYTTPSYTESRPKWRVITPFSKEYPAAFRAEMMNRVNGVFGGIFADESWTLSQAFHFGAVVGGDYRVEVVDGEYIDTLPELADIAIGKKTKKKISKESGRTQRDISLFEEAIAKKGGRLGQGDERRALLRAYISQLSKDGRSLDEIMALVGVVVDKYFDSRDTVDFQNIEEIARSFLDNDEVYDKRDATRQENIRIANGEYHQIPISTELSLREMLQDYVFITTGSLVVPRERPWVTYSKSDFDAKFCGSVVIKGKGIRPVTHVWMNDVGRLNVDTTTFRPGFSAVTEDPSGMTALNTWKEIPVPTSGDSPNLFIDHVGWLWGDRADDFLDWLAHMIQRPGERVQTHWLHIAPRQGMGRNWVSSVLVRILTRYSAPSVDLPALFDSGYNGVLSRKILAIVDEIDEGGGVGKWKHAERFKSLSSSETRNSNPKFGRQTVEWDVTRWLLFSNHLTALPLTSEDRRIDIAQCEENPRSQQYYDDIYAALMNPRFIDGVHIELATRDISQFKVGKRAKLSDLKRKVLSVSRSQQDVLLDLLKKHWPHDLITGSALVGVLVDPDREGNYPSGALNSAKHVLNRAGIFAAFSKVEVRGARYSLFSLRNHSDYRGDLEEKEVVRWYVGLPVEETGGLTSADGGRFRQEWIDDASLGIS